MFPHKCPRCHTRPAGEPAEPEERWFIVVVREEGASPELFALSHQKTLSPELKVLTSAEASELADAWNNDPAEGGIAHAVEIFLYPNPEGGT